ncbi:MAG TPA: hypothetical protein VFF73_07875 [Planctomycetota bacterium]|nr:hypothetical protein [Planctomycetota bacterium]
MDRKRKIPADSSERRAEILRELDSVLAETEETRKAVEEVRKRDTERRKKLGRPDPAD